MKRTQRKIKRLSAMFPLHVTGPPQAIPLPDPSTDYMPALLYTDRFSYGSAFHCQAASPKNFLPAILTRHAIPCFSPYRKPGKFPYTCNCHHLSLSNLQKRKNRPIRLTRISLSRQSRPDVLWYSYWHDALLFPISGRDFAVPFLPVQFTSCCNQLKILFLHRTGWFRCVIALHILFAFLFYKNQCNHIDNRLDNQTDSTKQPK